mmetsp:Transcript_22713/g.18796  ORF Transcript_22713/g.18796 Transcript_22713/m.18796 type:complete len:140 (-) Transcript_22713:103-522(-)
MAPPLMIALLLLVQVLDWLRAFLLCGLIIRDWVSFLFMFVIFTGLIYVMVFCFEIVVLRDRHDLRSSFCACITFPWYRLSSMAFRVGALLQNLLVYSHVRKGINIHIQQHDDNKVLVGYTAMYYTLLHHSLSWRWWWRR